MPTKGPVRPSRASSATWVKPPATAQMIAERALKKRKQIAKSKRGGLTSQEAGAQGITSGVERAKSIALHMMQQLYERVIVVLAEGDERATPPAIV